MSETILARFVKAQNMNYETGECDFFISPFYKHKLQDWNGEIRCKGKIQPFKGGTPIKVTGDVEEKHFTVTSYRLATDTKEELIRLFRFISKDITETQLENIANAVLENGGLFLFFKNKKFREILSRCLIRSKKKDYLTNLIATKVEEISASEDFFETLLEYDIPYDCIWVMAKNNVSLDIEDPYSLFFDYEVPISAADRYAREAKGFYEHSVMRFQYFIRCALRSSVARGDTCITFEDLYKKTNSLLQTAAAKNGKEKYMELPSASAYYCVTKLKNFCSVKEVNGRSYIYVNHIWDEETAVLRHVERLNNTSKKTSLKFDPREIGDYFGIRYNQGQLNAFKVLETTGIKIITGPPGSGKTTLIKGLIKAAQYKKIKLAATTGKAAEVLTSSCGITDKDKAATTVHAMLKVAQYGEKAEAAEKDINAELIVVDEMSMMGLEIFSFLISATRSDSILLLVGDESQLQSVEYGNVFGDLIQSGAVETYRLTEVTRSNNEITKKANDIRCGNLINACECFKITEVNSTNEALNHINKKTGSITFLSPFKKGRLGINELNSILQKKNKALDRRRFISFGLNDFYTGDKVIMTRNNYKKGYMNGDIGFVTAIVGDGLVVNIRGREIVLTCADIRHLNLAYANTVHKSQGSEYDNVVLVLPEKGHGLFTKRLLYTAVTRAKKEVEIISVKGAFSKALSQTTEQKRNTLLSERLAV